MPPSYVEVVNAVNPVGTPKLARVDQSDAFTAIRRSPLAVPEGTETVKLAVLAFEFAPTTAAVNGHNPVSLSAMFASSVFA